MSYYGNENPEWIRKQREEEALQQRKLAEAERAIAEREARIKAEQQKRTSRSDQGENPFLGRYGKYCSR